MGTWWERNSGIVRDVEKSREEALELVRFNVFAWASMRSICNYGIGSVLLD